MPMFSPKLLLVSIYRRYILHCNTRMRTVKIKNRIPSTETWTTPKLPKEVKISTITLRQFIKHTTTIHTHLNSAAY